MNRQPHDQSGQRQANSAQGEDHLRFRHDVFLSVSDGAGTHASTLGRDGAFSDAGLRAPSGSNPAPVLPCRQGPAFAGTAAGAANGPAVFSFVSASAESGPAVAATSAGTVPPMAPAALSSVDPGPCGFDFPDDDLEFDFSRLRKPALRLVVDNVARIPNSSSVKA